ncbi:MAG: hypothetical protein LBB49_01630 [Gracilibacteraceae bacterium]|jgi:hypothetical protein|nr:hypothetical protein [Gracilibacteraceae bacterium]
MKDSLLPVGEMAARVLFLASVLAFVGYAAIVGVAKIYGVGVDQHIIVVALLGSVLTLEALLHGVAHYSAVAGEAQPRGLTRHGQVYVSRMLTVMKLGTAVSSLVCMGVLVWFGFAFLDLTSPWTLGIYIMAGYAAIFLAWLLLPAVCFGAKICLSCRQSLQEWRFARIVLALAVSMVLTVVLAGLGLAFGWARVVIGGVTACVLLWDSMVMGYERYQATCCFREGEVFHPAALFWVTLFLHAPAWLLIIFMGMSLAPYK